MSHTRIPFGNVLSIGDLGQMLREKRAVKSMTQRDLAKAAGVGVRFISELENGKPTAEIAKVLKVIMTLGLELHVQKPHFKKVAQVI